MKAIVMSRFGGPEVLEPTEMELPVPGPGQVRIRVRAVGVNPIDGKIRSGAMQAMMPVALPRVPGLEAAGTVDAVGPGTPAFAVGDEVLGWTETGAYAQYALATRLAPKPKGLPFEAAVTLPVAAETSLKVLEELDVKAGETVLVHGGAGAVGTIAVQLLVAQGARVIATASPGNHEYLRSLGAVATEYGDGLVERVRALAPDGIDAVFDVAGKGALPASITLRGGKERIVTIADPAAMELGIPFSSSPPRPQSLQDLADLAEKAAAGDLVTTIAATFPLAEARAAQALGDGGHARGKVVLAIV